MGEGEFTYTMYFFSNRGQIWETIFLSKIPSASFVIPARTEPIRKEEKGRGGEGGGDNKRNNFNTISFLLFYKEKTVLNLCIYMYIQQILHQYISYFFFKNLHIIIASYQIVYNPS